MVKMLLFLPSCFCTYLLFLNSENNEVACSESQCWNLILNHKSLGNEVDNVLLVNNKYFESSDSESYRYHFSYMFDVLIMNKSKTTDSLTKESFWNGLSKSLEGVNVSYQISEEVLKENFVDVIFTDLNDSRDIELDSLRKMKKKVKKYYPIRKIENGHFLSIDLSDNKYWHYSFTIDLNKCIISDFHQYAYNYNLGVAIDDLTLIDFNMSLDSFYQIQYDEVLKRRKRLLNLKGDR